MDNIAFIIDNICNAFEMAKDQACESFKRNVKNAFIQRFIRILKMATMWGAFNRCQTYFSAIPTKLMTNRTSWNTQTTSWEWDTDTSLYACTCMCVCVHCVCSLTQLLAPP